MTRRSIEVMMDLIRAENETARTLREIKERLDRIEGTPVLLTIAAFARHAECSRDTVMSAIAAGDIEVVRLGPRTVRIPADQFWSRQPGGPSLALVDDEEDDPQVAEAS